jgi:hypothetical protein
MSIGTTADGTVTVNTGGIGVGDTGDKVGFMGAAPITVPAITGSLSTVADAPAKAVLTSIITELVALGLVTDGTS